MVNADILAYVNVNLGGVAQIVQLQLVLKAIFVVALVIALLMKLAPALMAIMVHHVALLIVRCKTIATGMEFAALPASAPVIMDMLELIATVVIMVFGMFLGPVFNAQIV